MCKCKHPTETCCNREDCLPDHRLFKVGDKVYSPMAGWGQVSVWAPAVGNCYVRFNHPGKDETYELCFLTDGRYCKGGEVMLFHDKPIITLPKKKVLKWLWAYQVDATNYGFPSTHITQNCYASEQEALLNTHANGVVKLPWTEQETEE